MPTRRAAGALAIVAACAALIWARRSALPAPRRPLGEVAPGAIVRLERESAGRALSLEKKGGRWLADGAAARAEPCDALARQAQALVLSSKVADDPESYESYGVDDAGAVRLRAWAEGAPAPALDVYLGKPAFGGRVLYARLKDEAEVRLAEGVDPALLALPATHYLAINPKMAR